MKLQRYLGCVGRSVLLFGLLVNTAKGSVFMMDVDFDADFSHGKTGTAAIGQTASDFWNVYLRNDGLGSGPDHWRTHGVMNNLSLVDGTATTVGMTVDNAPGSWITSSPDPMYNGYIYPFAGDATITLTGLPTGLYDLYAYCFDGNYELTVGTLSYGVRHTRDTATANPPVWTEGVQYARFRNVAMDGSQAMTLTVRAGIEGYAVISGFQLVAVPEPGSATLLGSALIAGVAWKRFRRGARS